MNISTIQLKKSILKKLEAINDTEYLASLDAVLSYESISGNEQGSASGKGKLSQSSWMGNSPMMKALRWLNRK